MAKAKKSTRSSAKKTKKEKEPVEAVENVPEEEINEPESILPYTDEVGQIFAAWEFSEFVKHAKGKWWYISFTILFLALLAYSYFADNILFAIIIVVFIILYLTIENRGPRVVDILIAEDGIVIDGKLIEYESLQNFYIVYYPPEIKNLYFQPKSNFQHRIVVPLEGQNPVEIRHVLLEFLDEDLEKEEMPSSESISRLLKL